MQTIIQQVSQGERGITRWLRAAMESENCSLSAPLHSPEGRTEYSRRRIQKLLSLEGRGNVCEGGGSFPACSEQREAITSFYERYLAHLVRGSVLCRIFSEVSAKLSIFLGLSALGVAAVSFSVGGPLGVALTLGVGAGLCLLSHCVFHVFSVVSFQEYKGYMGMLALSAQQGLGVSGDLCLDLYLAKINRSSLRWDSLAEHLGLLMIWISFLRAQLRFLNRPFICL